MLSRTSELLLVLRAVADLVDFLREAFTNANEELLGAFDWAIVVGLVERARDV